MYVIKNKKYDTYYKCKIDSKSNHFVSNIQEAKSMQKKPAEKVMSKFNKSENYELVYVKKK